jgi:hypothetical protein
MNDKDLERQLRAQRGPREEGYVPSDLPVTSDTAPRLRQSQLLRAAVLVPAIAAGVLAVAVAGAMLRGNGTLNIGGVTTPAPTASASGSVIGGIRVCRNEDLSISAEAWGAAAGSRWTVATVELANGRSPCALIPVAIAARMTDANGTVLIMSDIPHPMSRDVATMTANERHTFAIQWSNWCGPQPEQPVALSVSVEEGTHWKDVQPPAGGADPVPPCLGESEPSHLGATEVEPPN